MHLQTSAHRIIVMKQIKHLLTLFLIIFTLPAFAAPKYIEGQDYTRLPDEMRREPAIVQLAANNPQKVQLVLFFSFGCSACATFDPIFDSWASKQDNKQLVIYRDPVSFEDDWEDLAKLYYVMQDLKPSKNLNAAIFEAIHEQNLKLWQEPAMEEFFISQGYSAADFKAAYNSYNVEIQAKRADELAKAYDISQTPSIIINGPDASYLLTVGKAGGDRNKLMDIADYIIATEEHKLN